MSFIGIVTSMYSVQWVCPRQSSTLDTVLDASQSSAGQLVGVGRGGDVRWWRVREEEEEWEEGAGLVVEVLAVLKKTEMSSELGRFGYGKKMEVLFILYLLIFLYSSGGNSTAASGIE